jgi:hypothetical protein
MTAPLGYYQIFKALCSLVDILEYSLLYFTILFSLKFFSLKKIFSGNFNISINNLIGVKAAKILWCLENQFDNSSFAFKQIMTILKF